MRSFHRIDSDCQILKHSRFHKLSQIINSVSFDKGGKKEQGKKKKNQAETGIKNGNARVCVLP